jgi:hypothetical protein
MLRKTARHALVLAVLAPAALGLAGCKKDEPGGAAATTAATPLPTAWATPMPRSS